MNAKKFFQLAKEKGIEASELTINKSYSLSFSLFHSEIDSYKVSDSASISARGIVNGKFGASSTEKDDKTTPEFLIKSIVDSARVIEKDDKAILFKGSPKYKKKNLYNEKIEQISVKEKLDNLYKMEKRLKEIDPRITEVESVEYEEASSEHVLCNSYGLNLKSKNNHYVYVAAVVAKEGDDVKSGWNVLLSSDPDEFDLEAFCQKTVKKAVSKLGGKQCKSKKYPVLFNPECTANLLDFFIESASSEEVQKQSSVFIGKLNQVVASKKVTVLESPLEKNCFFRYFDDEGVATYNKKVLEKGVLKTFFYNLETAAREGVTTTGNGYSLGSKIGVGTVNIQLKPGKKSEQEIMSKIKEGIYITTLNGLHSGMNAQSGNFSLQTEGFVIREGKLAEPVSLITVAGNLFDLFKNVKEVANNVELQLGGTSAPSMLIKKLAISGK